MDGDQSSGEEGNDSYTKLLLHMDDTGLSDSSYVNHTTTKNGNAARSSTQSKFGGYSAYFDGAGDYITVQDSVDWAFGTGDFTIDCWIRPTSMVGTTCMVEHYQDNENRWGFELDNNNLGFYVRDGDVTTVACYGLHGITADGTWHHVAITRDGNDWRVFVDGTQVGSTVSDSSPVPNVSGDLLIGCRKWSGTPNYFYPGYIDELRITKGDARWTSNFTPATSRYGAHRVTANGDPHLDTSEKKFGSSSMRFDGTGDYLSVEDSGDWNFGSNAFTIDCWVYFTDLSGTHVLASQYESAQRLFQFWANASKKLNCFWGYDGTRGQYATTNACVDTGQWYHIVLARSGNDCLVFVDGVSQTMTAYTAFSGDLGDIDGPLLIGAYNHTSLQHYFNGYVDEFRVSKGIARWTTGFAVPTSEYTTDSNTVLLMHFNSDVSGEAQEVTFNGNPQLAVAPTKWNGSYYFDGTNDYISIPDSDDWNFGSGDFTMEAWVRYSSLSNDNIITQQGPSQKAFSFGRRNSGNVLRFVYTTDGSSETSFESAWTPNLNTWYHVAACRDGSDLRLFVDGTQVGSTHNISSATIHNSTSTLCIGDDANGGGIGDPFHGFMDELRIVKGEALYTSNFTPPAEPFSLYRVSGDLSESTRLVVLNESDWSITNNEVVSGSSYDIAFTTSDSVTIVGRKSNGECQAYGNVVPA